MKEKNIYLVLTKNDLKVIKEQMNLDNNKTVVIETRAIKEDQVTFVRVL